MNSKYPTLTKLNNISLDGIISNQSNKIINSHNLVNDFGHESMIGYSIMKYMINGLIYHLNKKKSTKIKILYEEWKSLFGQVSIITDIQKTSIEKSIKFLIEINEDNIPIILFVIHTYNSLIIKLLAVKIISDHGLTSHTSILMTQDKEFNDVINDIEYYIENGKIFEDAGVTGFSDVSMFGWYIDIYKSNPNHNNNDTDLFYSLLNKVSEYNTKELDSARTNDVLKHFYQELIPEFLRKSLGEFYTPDWLVNVVIDNCKIDHSYLRVLDPTCGSGSFLINIIKRKRQALELKNTCSSEILNNIVDTVWGFDLNPLAVLTSRLNYLISIADLLKNSGKITEIPVLLADAIYSPYTNKDDIVEYKIGSSIINLNVKLPSDIAFDRYKLELFFEMINNSINKNEQYIKFEEKIIRNNLLSRNKIIKYKISLEETYNNLLKLHLKNFNNIWFKIIKNFFWSANAGYFDLIIGNPPWVRWSSLPKEYREKIKLTCESYNIFSKTPYYGGNELDISGMITYTVADKWLKKDGLLSFVITKSHLQSPSSSGFRSFKIDEKYNLVPLNINDLSSLNIFKGANNRTVIVKFIKKEDKVTYPVSYNVWLPKNGKTKKINSDLKKVDVLDQLKIIECEANPVNDELSPWSILPRNKFKEFTNINGVSSWIQGRKGITVDLNGVYFVNIVGIDEANNLLEIETRPEAGKHNIGNKKRFWVEPTLLYPLLKGAGDFSAFQLNQKQDLYVLIPNKGILKSSFQESEDEMKRLPYTKKFFSFYKGILEQRSTYNKRMSNIAEYYCIYNVGSYSFSPYKVIWAEQSNTFKAVVVSGKKVPIIGYRNYVPDHKIYFVDFENENTAHYICSLLNSDIVKEFLSSYLISIQIGNIFKYLNLPKFDELNKDHINLCMLSKELHNNPSLITDSDIIFKINEITKDILAVK